MKLIVVNFKDKAKLYEVSDEPKTDTAKETKNEIPSRNLEEENKELIAQRKKADADRRALANKRLAEDLKSGKGGHKRW